MGFNQDVIEQYKPVAARVLKMCKDMQPEFHNPANNPNMANAWATVMARYPFPPACYYEAVVDFYAHNAGGERPGVGDVVAHARRVRDAWESEPGKRELLVEHRERRRVERDAAIAAGTFRGSGVVPVVSGRAGSGMSDAEVLAKIRALGSS